jgi:hypothetical protein
VGREKISHVKVSHVTVSRVWEGGGVTRMVAGILRLHSILCIYICAYIYIISSYDMLRSK